MPAGRPTTYSEILLEKAQDYLKVLPADEVIHTVAGLAVYLGISRDTVYEWAKEEDERGKLTKPEFSDIVVQILANQEKSLVNKGLEGKFNATISKLLLAKHGYKEESDVTSGGDKMSGVIILPKRNEETEDTLDSSTETRDSTS